MSSVDPSSTPPPYGAQSTIPASSEDRTLALLVHLSGIVLGFVVPLIVWLVHKDRDDKPFLVEQAREALNFNLTLLGVYLALFVLTIVTFGLAGPFSFLLWVASIVLFVVAGIKANNGESYRYPYAVRVIK